MRCNACCTSVPQRDLMSTHMCCAVALHEAGEGLAGSMARERAKCGWPARQAISLVVGP